MFRELFGKKIMRCLVILSQVTVVVSVLVLTSPAVSAPSELAVFRKVCAEQPLGTKQSSSRLSGAGYEVMKSRDDPRLNAVIAQAEFAAREYNIPFTADGMIAFKSSNAKVPVYFLLSENIVASKQLNTCYLYHFDEDAGDAVEQISMWLGAKPEVAPLAGVAATQSIWRTTKNIPGLFNMKVVQVENDAAVAVATGWTGYSLSTSYVSK